MTISRIVEDQLLLQRARVRGLQRKLDFADWHENPHFSNKMGIGRTAFYAVFLGLVWGFYACACISVVFYLIYTDAEKYILSKDRLVMLLRWSLYCVSVASFHFLEFTTTVLYNPRVCSADSFLINHSTGYTLAALTSWSEFWIRFMLSGRLNTSASSGSIHLAVCIVAVILLLFAQTLRSSAMVTAGVSFNHQIQIVKHKSHKLIQDGVYKYFRHASYVGFFYWTLATQLLLGNYIHAVILTVASWQFFKRRIAYEEASLCELFPGEYPDYVKKTYMGIPFISSSVSMTFVEAAKTSESETKED